MRLLPSFIAPALAAALSLAAYLATLAPTVTFEDSGELITAAFHLGVPHEPGYPLYTLLGHFASHFPLGNVAYRLNLLSAFCTALGIFFLSWALQRAAGHLGDDRTAETPDLPAQIVALTGGLLGAFAFETWEQSLIAEVYGLHTAFVGLVLYLTVAWSLERSADRKRRTLLLLAFVLGLASSHHTTTVLILPVVAIYVIWSDPGLVLRAEVLAKAAALFIAGLLPWAYLPWASARDPVLDWGDPETLDRFLQVVGRHQYGVSPTSSLQSALDHLQLYFELLGSQWPAAVLLLVVPGLSLLWRRHKPWLALLAALWTLTGPLTTCLINFPIGTEDAWINAENTALASVFFIPSYLVIAFVVGLGLFSLLRALPRRMAFWLAPLALVAPLGAAVQNGSAVDLSRHVFAESYVHDLFRITTPGALILTHWDPFYFPTLYYQHVEGQRSDLAVIDQPLLRRSWYLRQLQRTHARWLKPVEREIGTFLSEVEPFERGLPYNGYRIEAAYLAMINALVDRTVENGLEVFSTYRPDESIASAYTLEPMAVAYRLQTELRSLSPLPLDELRIRTFLHPAVQNDRMAVHVQEHIGTLLRERAQLASALGNRDAFNHVLPLAKQFAGAIQQQR